jgi:hypothetical protein
MRQSDMADQVIGQLEQKTVKRFTSYEDFLKEFYPRSTERETQEKTEENRDFGMELALDSLNKHANALKFTDD